MRFTVEQENFLVALKTAYSVVPAKPLQQLADHFVIQFRDDLNTVSIGGSNGVSAVLAALKPGFVTDSSGTLVVPAKMLLASVERMPEGAVTLDSSQHTVVVRSEVLAKADVSLPTADANLYPPIPDPATLPTNQWYTVPRESLLQTITAVKSAIPADATQQMLFQISVSESENFGSTFTATDSVRLHRQSSDTLVLPQFSILALSVTSMVNMLKGCDYETVSVWVGKTSIVLKCADDYAIYQRPQARFPDVHKSIVQPAMTNTRRLHIDRDAFTAALEAVAVTADDSTQAVALRLTHDGYLEIHTKNDIGATSRRVLEVLWPYEDTLLAFRLRFLLDALKAYPSALCEVRLPDPKVSKHGAILMLDTEHQFTAVVSQLRLELL